MDDNFVLQHAVLATEEMIERQTGSNLCFRIESITSEFGITSITAIVTDNGSNILRAVVLLDASPQISCFSHNVYLAVMQGCKTDSVKRLLSALKRLVKHFNKSAKKTTALKKSQRDALGPDVAGQDSQVLTLVAHVKTRWNSIFAMCERMVKLRYYVEDVLTDPAQFARADAAVLKLTPSQWSMMEKVIPSFDTVQACYCFARWH